MREKPGLKPSACNETQAAFDRISRLPSSTECTGLVPGGVMDESQSEAYSELYDIHPPKIQHEEKK